MQPVSSTRDILIQTERASAARAFYEGVLGFPVVQDDPAMCGLDTGSFRLFIDPAPDLGPVLEFEVADVAAMKARLLAAGCSLLEENPSIPRCYVRDPFGLIFNLRQTVKSASNAGIPAEERFEHQNLAGAVFQDCSLAGALFENNDLAGSRFTNVRLADASFANVSLAGVTIDDANIAGLTIFGHDIQALIRAELQRQREAGSPPGVHASGSGAGSPADLRFEIQNLAEAVFRNCSLARAVFENNDLNGSRFTNVRLENASFTNVNLAGVTIEDANIAGLTIFGHDIQALIRAELQRQREA